MEILKRIINLIYALLMMGFITLVAFGRWLPLTECLLFLGGTALFFSVINFALFKNFTIWNK